MNTKGSDSRKHPIRVGQNVVSRRRLARLVGVTPIHIGLIFSGKRNPSADLLNKIALVFDVPMDEIWQILQEIQQSNSIMVE